MNESETLYLCLLHQRKSDNVAVLCSQLVSVAPRLHRKLVIERLENNKSHITVYSNKISDIFKQINLTQKCTACEITNHHLPCSLGQEWALNVTKPLYDI